MKAEVCPDHVHMLLEIPPKVSVSSFMGYVKGKSSLMIYKKYPELRYKYRNREFWCRGYYVDTAGKNAKRYKEKELFIVKIVMESTLDILVECVILKIRKVNFPSERRLA